MKKKFEVKANDLKVKIKIKKTSKKAIEEYASKSIRIIKDSLNQYFKDFKYTKTLSTVNVEKLEVFAERLNEFNIRFTKTKSEKSKKQIAIDAEYEMYFVLVGLDQNTLFLFEDLLFDMEKGNKLYKSIDPRLFKVILADFYRHIYYVYNDGDIANKFQKYWSHTLDNPDDDKIIGLNKNKFTIENLTEAPPDKLHGDIRDALKNKDKLNIDVIEASIIEANKKFSKLTEELYSVESPNPLEFTKGGSDERKEERKDIEESTKGSVQE